jgi:hypothetical protein
VEEFKKLRYEAYERMGDTESQRILGREFLIGGKLDCLSEIKALYGDDEWPAARREILDILKTNDPKGIYPNILAQEGLISELLAYCGDKLSPIVRYYAYLLPDYEEDVRTILTKHIYASAAAASERYAYQNVCGILELYKELYGDEAYSIRDELRGKYSRRPAFKEELGRL